MTQSTHAVRIHAYGGAEQMHYERRDVPQHQVNEVQIRRQAIGFNYLDTYHRHSIYSLPALPGVPGVEAAGEISAIGEGVQGFKSAIECHTSDGRSAFTSA